MPTHHAVVAQRLGRDPISPPTCEALTPRTTAHVVHVAHRFPFRGARYRDPSAYLLSPTYLLTQRIEEFRSLRAQLRRQVGATGILLVASAHHAEGRSISALSLSIALTREYERVVYVEADFRRPALHTFFDVPAGRGMAELLRRSQPITSVGAYTLATDVPGLYLIPAGVSPDAHIEAPSLLASPHLPELFGRLRNAADWIIVDCSPLLGYSDALPLLSLVDGVVLIAREGCTREADFAKLSARLAAAHARVLSALFIEHEQ